MIGLLIGTLRSPLVNRLPACAAMSFLDMVAASGRIEDFIRRGIIQSSEQPESGKRSNPMERKADVSNIIDAPRPYSSNQ